MAFTLEKVVPWGRSYDEYASMFSLSGNDLTKKIIGCSDGPASFNCELTRKGGTVVSVDPIYRFSAKEIEARIEETYSSVLEQTKENEREFVWKNVKSPDELGKARMSAMKRFLSDYLEGKEKCRYINAELPVLPFSDKEFDLALCSHFLFLYSEHYSFDFHIQSIAEMCRVAGEARIFPVLELGAKKSRHLAGVVEKLRSKGYECSIEKVDYEFQKGGNEMLRVKII